MGQTAAEGSQRDVQVPVQAWSAQGDRTTHDRVVAEEPLEVRAYGPSQDPITLVTTLRTPGNEGDLAAGWLYSEGLVSPGGIIAMRFGDPVELARPDDQITVEVAQKIDVAVAAHRHTTATASCGVCGRASIEELAARCAPISADIIDPVPWPVIAHLPDALSDAQSLFKRTGGLHATGLFTLDGTLVTLREDVGRHNALDAAIGVHVRACELPLHTSVAVLSGRVGFELVAKAAMAGVGVLVAVGAPTDLAVRTAQRLGVTLVGFVRAGAGNVYAHGHRIAS